MVNKLVEIFYPKHCIFCGTKIKNDKGYCDKCYYKLPILSDNTCLICGRELYGEFGYRVCATCRKHRMHFDCNYPVFIYDGIIRSAFKRYKFCGQMWYKKIFAKFMIDKLKPLNLKVDYIVYPPINRKTFYERGYNQSDIMAKLIGKELGIKVLDKAIIKVKQNNKQSLAGAKMRFSNVRGVFKVNKKYKEVIKDSNILVIDDVLTTGATLNEIAKALKKENAKRVYGSTLCVTR